MSLVAFSASEGRWLRRAALFVSKTAKMAIAATCSRMRASCFDAGGLALALFYVVAGFLSVGLHASLTVLRPTQPDLTAS